MSSQKRRRQLSFENNEEVNPDDIFGASPVQRASFGLGAVLSEHPWNDGDPWGVADVQGSEVGSRILFDEGKDPIGTGASGTVFLGEYRRGDDTMPSAVKVIAKDAVRADEIMIQSKLSKLPECYKHIACLYDAVEHGDDMWVAMEYVPGTRLIEVRDQDELDVPLIRKIAYDLIEGLRYMHSNGVAHGDIKLENIMIDNEDNIKYIDFGLGCVKGDNSCNDRYVPYHGTPLYIPPEGWLRLGRQPTPIWATKFSHVKRADYWALGFVLLELLLSRYPTSGEKDEDGVPMGILEDIGLTGYDVSKQSQIGTIVEFLEKNVPGFVLDPEAEDIYNIVEGLLRVDPKDRRLPPPRD